MKKLTVIMIASIFLAGCANAAVPSDAPTTEITSTLEFTPTPLSIYEALAPVARGQGVSDAAVYDPDAPGPHRLIILKVSGEPHSWNEQLPPDWTPSVVSETELVVVVEDREVKLGSQAYIGGPSITRYRYEVDVQVREARTGEVLMSRTLKGSDPGSFPQTAPKEQTRMTGSRVDYADLQDGLFDENELDLGIRSHCWLTWYTEKLLSGALTSDGQILASGGYTDSNIVELWEVANGTLLHSLEGSTDSRVASVTFSPDEQILASGSGDGIVHLWRVSDGELLHTLVGHTERVSRLAFSPDGQILASGSSDSVRLWQVSDGALLHTLEGFVFSLAFSPDGQVLASGVRDNTVSLSQIANGKLLLTLKGHTNRATSLAFSLDGEMLASASMEDMTVRLWRVSNGELLHTLKGHTGFLMSVAFSPDGQMLASGSLAEIRLWQVADGALLHTLWRHTDNVTNLAFSPDGKNLISGSKDAICLWTIQE